MKSFILAVVLLTAHSFVQGGTLLGSNKCTYGPSYWCASFQNAKDCSATKHCLENSWVKSSERAAFNPLEDSTCTFCKDVVSDIHDYLTNNDSEAQILAYLDRACGYMPDQFSIDECKKIGSHYLEEFLALIDKEIDPETICELLQLCGSKQKHDLSAKKSLSKFKAAVSAVKVASKGDSSMCDACKGAEQWIKSQVDNKDNQAAFKKMLESECQMLGGDLAAECEQLVETLVPEIVTLIDDNLNDQLCVMLHMCTSSVDVMAAAKKSFSTLIKKSQMKTHITGVASRTGEDLCTTCEEIFNYLHIFMNNNASMTQVEQLMENEVCTQLGTFSSMCKELVEEYFPQIWMELLQVLDPKSICTTIGLCNSTSTAVTVTKVKEENSVQCVLCEFVMKELVSLISSHATEQEIVDALDKVCSILPSSIKSECDKFVEKYGKEIVDLLMNDVSPKLVCSAIQLCASAPTASKLAGSDCVMCEMALAYLKSDLAKNATQEQIVAALEKLCSHLSADLATQCVDIIKQYGPTIIKILDNDMDAKTLCIEFGMCTASVQTMKVDGLVHLYNKDRASNV